ncbi:MAG TPA: thermonuclease family protein [Acidimicrobiia bacterium]|nr:thermonuclease family protein [Acidimicrobiia bacterium]
MLGAAGEQGGAARRRPMEQGPAGPGRRRKGVVLAAALAAASLGGWRLGAARRSGATDGPAGGGSVRVTAVVDGDTVDVARAGRHERVRLLGVDTPETVDPHRPIGCFGPEASAYTHRRLLGRTVRLGFDRERRDRYGRLLAYLELDGHRFNDELLEGGYARLLVIPPNGLHGRVMLDEELGARAARRGLWGACRPGGSDGE